MPQLPLDDISKLTATEDDLEDESRERMRQDMAKFLQLAEPYAEAGAAFCQRREVSIGHLCDDSRKLRQEGLWSSSAGIPILRLEFQSPMPHFRSL